MPCAACAGVFGGKHRLTSFPDREVCVCRVRSVWCVCAFVCRCSACGLVLELEVCRVRFARVS